MNLFRLLALSLSAASWCAAEVAVVMPRSAHSIEKLAASELAAYLAKIYPGERFSFAERQPASGSSIAFTHMAGPAESYAISGAGGKAVISAADPRGALFAVYALLEKLGCGFYLSSETVPPPRAGAVRFEDWNLKDAPILEDRIVFNWHNFLSSASTWEFEDWQRYIDNSLRMRFNDLMVHAYGNNPMFTFRFGGKTKPIGYLATTRAGRDWGTQHVNDVRRMVGGELFTDAVFGSSIAKVPEAERAPAAQSLMKRVFAHAAGRGMKITFALDVDTESANDQDMISTLPASARISSGKYQLANPDTPEGYAFYKAQADQLMALYPQITRLAVWFRNNRTPWTSIKLEEFPPAWKQEFQGDPGDAFVFAVGKLVRAFGRALKEGGHSRVELASGTWRFELNKAADRYLPPDAAFLPLDWSTVFDTPAGQRALRDVASGRKLIPIVWAHHDDRTYIGRPYTPYVNFTNLMKSAGGSGFGIIHWTTRPLDLYFKSTVEQSWRLTRDLPLEDECERMAVRSFGEAARIAGREYLFHFVTEGPMFGRETSDRFMDVALTDPEGHIKKSRARTQLLSRIDASALAPAGRARLDYFRAYEEFIAGFFATQTAFERAQAHLKAREFDQARAEIAKAKPEDAIRAYVRAASTGDITGGERALVVSLNLRWLPYFTSVRQAVGLEPVRVMLGKVEREPLAQGPGRNTFHFDEQGRLWRVLEPEAGARTMTLGAIMNDRLEPGRYSINGGAPVEAKNGQIEVPLAPGAREIVIARVTPPK
jgi:hypothetical protein